MLRMERTTFERLVHRALSAIPQEFRAYLENVDVIVEDWPTTAQLKTHSLTDEDVLLGLYARDRALGARSDLCRSRAPRDLREERRKRNG